MSAFSDYLESGLLHHVFLSTSFTKPTGLAIALTSGVPADSETGGTIPEVPSGINGSGTGYTRIPFGPPATSGDTMWTFDPLDYAAGSGVIKNTASVVWNTALVDWGWVSGIALLDMYEYGSGTLLMHSALDNPRIVYQGDTLKFDANALKVNFK